MRNNSIIPKLRRFQIFSESFPFAVAGSALSPMRITITKPGVLFRKLMSVFTTLFQNSSSVQFTDSTFSVPFRASLPAASSASAMTAAVREAGIFNCIFMPVFTVSVASWSAIRQITSKKIFSKCHGFEMFRIHAILNSTEMVYNKMFRDLSFLNSISKAMRGFTLFSVKELDRIPSRLRMRTTTNKSKFF